jgi:hypothetical protein
MVNEGSRLYASFHSENFIKSQLLSKFQTTTKKEDGSIHQTIWCGIK